LQKKDQDAIHAHIQGWLERYLEIESFLNLEKQSFDFHQRFPVNELIEAENAADAMRFAWGLGFDPLDNLMDTLESREIKIHQLDCSGDFDACTFYHNHIPVIAINRNFPGDRQRFSIAHELGHIILNVRDADIIEKVANRFAGAFLLPRQAIYQELGEKRTSISPEEIHLIKHKFGISMQAIIYRAKDVGIISGSLYTQMMKEFSIQGFRQKEPGEPFPVERARRMEKLLLRLLSEEVISRSRAEELYDGKLIELEGAAAM